MYQDSTFLEEEQSKIKKAWDEIALAYSSLDQEISNGINTVGEKLQEIELYCQNIRAKEFFLESKKQEIIRDSHELENRLNLLKPYGVLISGSSDGKVAKTDESFSFPENFGQNWTNFLKSSGLYITEQI